MNRRTCVLLPMMVPGNNSLRRDEGRASNYVDFLKWILSSTREVMETAGSVFANMVRVVLRTLTMLRCAVASYLIGNVRISIGGAAFSLVFEVQVTLLR
jgi:hypothetical protein